jgi:integrase
VERVDKDLRLLAEAALHTGCAYGELIGLRVEDYLRDVGCVQVLYGKTDKLTPDPRPLRS